MSANRTTGYYEVCDTGVFVKGISQKWITIMLLSISAVCNQNGEVTLKTIDQKAMLLSIKAEYARKILAGEKQFEYRKTRCRENINHIIIYATSPVKAVVGEADISEVLQDTPEVIWKKTKAMAGVEKEDFDLYFKGKKTAVAYALCNVSVFEEPRELIQYGIRTAPQSYRYL